MDKSSETMDLTDFFLEWRATCAIDKCSCAEEVAYVHRLYDAKFLKLTNTVRSRRFGKGTVKSVSEFANVLSERLHAFHLIELKLYAGETIKGLPFKKHLFEVVAMEKGVGFLNGYFLAILATIARESFDKSIVAERFKDREGNEVDPLEAISSSDPAFSSSDSDDQALTLAKDECFADFQKAIREYWDAAKPDMRIALLCDCYNIPRSNPEILKAVGLGKSAFSNRKPHEGLRKVFEDLSERFGSDIAQYVFKKDLYDFIEELGASDPMCAPVFEVRNACWAK